MHKTLRVAPVNRIHYLGCPPLKIRFQKLAVGCLDGCLECIDAAMSGGSMQRGRGFLGQKKQIEVGLLSSKGIASLVQPRNALRVQLLAELLACEEHVEVLAEVVRPGVS